MFTFFVNSFIDFFWENAGDVDVAEIGLLSFDETFFDKLSMHGLIFFIGCKHGIKLFGGSCVPRGVDSNNVIDDVV